MQDNKVPFGSRFSHISDLMGSKFLFFDSELQSMYNNVKELYNTFQTVKKRFDRKETVRVSKTQTEFMQMCKDAQTYPYALYSFVCRDVNISVVQHKKRYYVFVDGFTPSNNFAHSSLFKCYCESENLQEAVNYFSLIVQEFICQRLGVLAIGVPF